MEAKVSFKNSYPITFTLGVDGDQKTAVKHNFDCLQTSPVGFGNTYEEAINDLCLQLGLEVFKISISNYDGAMTSQEKDKFICEQLKNKYKLEGVCWHEIKPEYRPTTRGFDAWDGGFACAKCGIKNPENFNFTTKAGRVQLLELMEKSGKLGRFLAWLNGLSLDEDGDLIDNCVPVDFLLDNTEMLRDKVFEWLGGEE